MLLINFRPSPWTKSLAGLLVNVCRIMRTSVRHIVADILLSLVLFCLNKETYPLPFTLVSSGTYFRAFDIRYFTEASRLSCFAKRRFALILKWSPNLQPLWMCSKKVLSKLSFQGALPKSCQSYFEISGSVCVSFSVRRHKRKGPNQPQSLLTDASKNSNPIDPKV